MLSLVQPVAAATDFTSGSAEEAGLRIAVEARQREKGFGNFTATVTMTLRNKKGRESQRELRLKIIEVADSGDRTLMVFDNPKDVRGTAFLVHAHKDQQDQQWLYLPALKRVKRINAANQSGSFLGSEFAYEDLATVEVEKFSHRYLGDETCGANTCYAVERIPVSKSSGYSRQVVWFDQEQLRAMQVDYFDRRDKHLKTMTLEDYELHLERFWRASRVTMKNHLTGKSTFMLWSGYDFGTDLKPSDFTKTALKQVR